MNPITPLKKRVLAKVKPLFTDECYQPDKEYEVWIENFTGEERLMLYLRSTATPLSGYRVFPDQDVLQDSFEIIHIV